jgi:hypothetical protein
VILPDTGKEIPLYEESHALGVDDYTNGWPKLRGELTLGDLDHDRVHFSPPFTADNA